jgi:hypothetical protein
VPPDITDDIAVGTKVFTRTEKLRRLLDEMPEWVTTVYVADDGEQTTAKSDLYDRSYPFQLEVLDLEYDAGLGAGRNAIVDSLSEDYVIIVDSDHVVPPTATILYRQLKSQPKMGAIGGAIVEPNQERIYVEGQDFVETSQGSEEILTRGPHAKYETKDIRIVEQAPLIEFDLLPNAALFRRECLEEQAWDSHYTIEREHGDFYIAQWKYTDWDFAVSPSVYFPHYPGGDTQYMLERHNRDKWNDSQEYFLEKWGYNTDSIQGWNWMTTYKNQPKSKRKARAAVNILVNDGAVDLLRRVRFYIKKHIL